jgi:hypothetical protein
MLRKTIPTKTKYKDLFPSAPPALTFIDQVAALASLFVPPPPPPHPVFSFTAQQAKDNACGFSL